MNGLTPSEPIMALRRGRSLRWFGWVQVALTALAMVATLPGRTHGLGMITERLLADLQLNRVSFASINLCATLLGAAFCLPIGYLIERARVRLMLTLVVASLAAVVLLMCQINLPLAEKVSQGLGGLTSPETSLIVILFVAVLLTRGLGQSALSVVSLAMAGKWFERRLSMAMALFSVLVSIGFTVAFARGRELADWKWQSAWAVLGWSLLVFAPVA
jgi:MFS family permease